MLDRLWLIPVGFVIGAYGTLIGARGGFVLVPMLILLYAQEAPGVITSISLAVVFFNALSDLCRPSPIHDLRSPNNLLNSSESTRIRRATSRSLSTSSGGSLNAVGNLLKCIRSVSSFSASNFTSIT